MSKQQTIKGVDEAVWAKARAKADRQHASMGAVVAELLTRWVEEGDAPAKVLTPAKKVPAEVLTSAPVQPPYVTPAQRDEQFRAHVKRTAVSPSAFHDVKRTGFKPLFRESDLKKQGRAR